jgi:hypothetical protein
VATEKETAMKNTVKPWADVHADYKTTDSLGIRRVLVLDEETGATVLAPWTGPADAFRPDDGGDATWRSKGMNADDGHA